MQDSQKTFSIISAQTLLDTSKRKLFYHAHISSHLTYASTVLDGWSEIILQGGEKKLNSLHKRAAKLMLPNRSITTEAKIQLRETCVQ